MLFTTAQMSLCVPSNSTTLFYVFVYRGIKVFFNSPYFYSALSVFQSYVSAELIIFICNSSHGILSQMS